MSDLQAIKSHIEHVGNQQGTATRTRIDQKAAEIIAAIGASQAATILKVDQRADELRAIILNVQPPASASLDTDKA